MTEELPRIRQFILTAEFVRAVMNLSSKEAGRVWKTLDLMARTPNSPGLGLENLSGRAGLKSARVSQRLRIILWASSDTPVLVFVGAHDEAYRHATRLFHVTGSIPLSLPSAAYSLAIAPLAGLLHRFRPQGVAADWECEERLFRTLSRPLHCGTVKSLLTHGKKYLPLMQYLLSRNPEDKSCVLDFSRLEEILGSRLPLSARAFRAWWANDPTHTQSKAWLAAGWKAGEVSMRDGRVQFLLEESDLARSQKFRKEMERAEAKHREEMERAAAEYGKEEAARKEAKARVLVPANEECRRLAEQMKSAGLRCPFCGVEGKDFRFYDGALEIASYFVCSACGRSFRLTDMSDSSE